MGDPGESDLATSVCRIPERVAVGVVGTKGCQKRKIKTLDHFINKTFNSHFRFCCFYCWLKTVTPWNIHWTCFGVFVCSLALAFRLRVSLCFYIAKYKPSPVTLDISVASSTMPAVGCIPSGNGRAPGAGNREKEGPAVDYFGQGLLRRLLPWCWPGHSGRIGLEFHSWDGRSCSWVRCEASVWLSSSDFILGPAVPFSYQAEVIWGQDFIYFWMTNLFRTLCSQVSTDLIG